MGVGRAVPFTKPRCYKSNLPVHVTKDGFFDVVFNDFEDERMDAIISLRAFKTRTAFNKHIDIQFNSISCYREGIACSLGYIP